MSGTREPDSVRSSEQRDSRVSRLPLAITFTLWAVGLWCLLAGFTCWYSGQDALPGLTLAAVICTVPGIVIFAFVRDRLTTSPVAGIAISGIRMVAVFFLAMFAVDYWPALTGRRFFLQFALFYVATLIVETWLLALQININSNLSTDNSDSQE